MRLWARIVSAAILALFSSQALADEPGVCSPNTVYAGPSIGNILAPLTCRALVIADLPSTIVNRAACTNFTAITVGGVGDGVTDNSFAFSQLVASPTFNGCIYFPAGKYVFNKQLTYSLPNVVGAAFHIIGDGIDVTQLIWPQATGQGIAVTYTNINNGSSYEGLTFVTAQAGAGTAVAITQNVTSLVASEYVPPTVFRTLAFRSDEGYTAISHYWSTAIALTRVSVLTVDTVTISGLNSGNGYAHVGAGVNIGGGSSTYAPVVATFTNFQCILTGVCINYGTYVQGVLVTNSNFVGCNLGINVPAGNTANDELTVTGSQFNCDGYSIQLGVAVPDLTVENNVFLIPGNVTAYGIGASAVNRSTIVGNIFAGIYATSGNCGACLQTSSDAGLVADNVFDSLHTGLSFTNLSGWTAHANTYNNVTVPFINTGDPSFTNIIDLPQDCSAGLNLIFNFTNVGMTYTNKTCQFTRNAKTINIAIDITLSNKGSSTGSAILQSLPVAAASGYNATLAVGQVSAMSGITSAPTGVVSGGTSALALDIIGSTGAVGMTDANFTNTSRIQLSGSYLTQ